MVALVGIFDEGSERDRFDSYELFPAHLAGLTAATAAFGLFENRTRVQMNGQLDAVGILLFQDFPQPGPFLMAFFDGVEPGKCQIAVHIQEIAVFDDLGVMDVYPVGRAFFVQFRSHVVHNRASSALSSRFAMVFRKMEIPVMMMMPPNRKARALSIQAIPVKYNTSSPATSPMVE